MTTHESTIFNPGDGVRNCNPHQGFTIIESHALDGSNGRMKDDFCGITRGTLILEAPIGVDSRREVWNGPPAVTATNFSVPVPVVLEPK